MTTIRVLFRQISFLFALLLSFAAASAVADITNVQNATSADAPHEVLEPAVLESTVFFRSCRCNHTFDYTAFMHNATPSTFQPVIRVAQKDATSNTWQVISNLDLGNEPGQNTPFNQSADPVLASNPNQFGVNGYRVYLAGVTLNRQCPGSSSTPDTQISVWYTDDGGTIWNRYPGIEYHNNESVGNWFDDKPHIAVSQNSNNLGYVYLAFVVDGDPSLAGQSGIKLFRLTTSGGSWQNMGYVVTGSVQSPRIDVNPNDTNGTVYLSWLDQGSNTVNVKSSSDQGSTWSSTASQSTGTLIVGGLICSNSSSNNCVQALSTLSTRWNSGNSRLEAVFHHRQASGGNSAEVVRASYTPGSGWSTPAVVSSNSSSHYSWNGAIACATDGTCLVTFYDMDPNEGSASPGLNYRVVGRYDGSSSDTTLYSTSTAANPYRDSWTLFDPSQLPAQCRYFSTPFYTPGDYQDVVYFNNAYTAAALYSTGNGNKNDIFILKP